MGTEVGTLGSKQPWRVFGSRRIVEDGPRVLNLNAWGDSDVKNKRALCRKREEMSLALTLMTLSYQEGILVNEWNQQLELYVWNLRERSSLEKKICMKVTVLGIGIARLAKESGLKSKKEN